MSGEFEAEIRSILGNSGYVNVAVRQTDALRNEFTVWGRLEGKKEIHILAKGSQAELMGKLQRKIRSDKAFGMVYSV